MSPCKGRIQEPQKQKGTGGIKDIQALFNPPVLSSTSTCATTTSIAQVNRSNLVFIFFYFKIMTYSLFEIFDFVVGKSTAAEEIETAQKRRRRVRPELPIFTS